jgi:hypothetical protein
MFLEVNKTKNPPRAYQLRISRAPPWCFLSIIQSCLPPRLRPPINNPLSVSIIHPMDPSRSMLNPQGYQFPPGTLPSSMLFASIALLVTVCSCHHLPCRGDISTPSSPPLRHRTKQTLPTTPAKKTIMVQTTTT